MKINNFFKLFLLALSFSSTTHSCTKLDPEVYDKVVHFWQSPDQIAAGIAPVYIGLRAYAPTFMGGPNLYNLLEASSDELIVPKRGTDWADNVIWEEMWKHSWKPNHQFIQEGWAFIYGGIARINLILQTLNGLNPRPNDFPAIEAELKTLRAFYYYFAMDLFGNVPIYELGITDPVKLGTRPRQEIFTYVENELKANLPALTTEVNQKTYGRATKWAAEALLAKLYLNAEVFTGESRWSACIAACDAILQSNKYSLEPNFFNNFLVANEKSKENIFVIPFDRNAGLDFFLIQAFTLHYESFKAFGLESFGFNGFCSTAEFYNLFDSSDARRKMFLVGQQYENQIQDPAHILYDRSGNPLFFDPVITTFSILPPKAETAGARCAKWEFNKEGWGNMSNDFTVFRLADILLMKAEAQFRNGDLAAALTTINQKINGVSIRSRAGLPDFSQSEMDLEGLLAERARELAWEGHRRNDLIRFGKYTGARIPEKALSANYRQLYPIPQAELDKNPYLKQNPGY